MNKKKVKKKNYKFVNVGNNIHKGCTVIIKSVLFIAAIAPLVKKSLKISEK